MNEIEPESLITVTISRGFLIDMMLAHAMRINYTDFPSDDEINMARREAGDSDQYGADQYGLVSNATLEKILRHIDGRRTKD